MAQTIVCPECGAKIPLDDALAHQIEEGLRKEFEQKSREQEKALAEQRKELKTRESQLQADVKKQVEAARKELEKEAATKAEASVTLELSDLKAQLAEQTKAKDDAEKRELELRKQQRELETKTKNLELEVARKLDEERNKIRKDALASAEEQHHLKDKQREKTLDDLKAQLAEAQRRAEQGSQQAQGEVLELDLEDLLKSTFPQDTIEPVPKGIRGADVIQRIRDRSGRDCGAIAWETKRTKAWSEGWIQKLKDDQRTVKADLAVLLTTALPDEIKTFASRDGVWVTSHACALGLGAALRTSLIEVAAVRTASTGKHDKMEVLYDYLSGPDFRGRVEAIVEGFVALKTQLDSEKRAMARIWAARDKQIERVVQNTAGMYGDLQGIIGAPLAKIEHLELKALPDDESHSEE